MMNELIAVKFLSPLPTVEVKFVNRSIKNDQRHQMEAKSLSPPQQWKLLRLPTTENEVFHKEEDQIEQLLGSTDGDIFWLS